MHAVTGDELAEMQTELVVGVGGNVVKLVDGDQAVVELLHTKLIYGEAERRVCADQYLVAAVKKGSNGFDLSAVVIAGRVTEVGVWGAMEPKVRLRSRF